MNLKFLIFFTFTTFSYVQSQTFSHQYKCISAFPDNLDALNDEKEMYNIAFSWSLKSKLHDWTYAPCPNCTTIEPDMSCTHLSYSTPIRLPSPIAAYYGTTHYNILLQKDTCFNQNKMHESIRVKNIPFVGVIAIQTMTTLDHNDHIVHTRSRFHIDIPWFFQFLKSQIDTEIKKSETYKQRLVMEFLCPQYNQIA